MEATGDGGIVTVLMGAQYTIHMPPPYLLRTSMHFYITEKTNCRIFYITLEANSRFSKESELVLGPNAHGGFHKPQEICLFPTHFNTSSLAQQTKLISAQTLLHNQPNSLLTEKLSCTTNTTLILTQQLLLRSSSWGPNGAGS